MPDNLFGQPDLSPRDLSERDELLIRAYDIARRTLDDLPYTKEFDAIFAEVGHAFDHKQDQVFRRLHNLRKAGRLPKSGLRGVSPAAVKPEEEELLIALVKEHAGALGQRDQLPYTPPFDLIVDAFNRQTRRALPPHDVWRLIARLAK